MIANRLISRLTEGGGYVADQSDDQHGLEEASRLRVQSDHVVHDGGEEHRDGQEYRDLCQCFAQEVDVRPIHPVVVFSHKHWHL